MQNKKLHEQRSYGIFCVHKNDKQELEFLIVNHNRNYNKHMGDFWAFPKGSPEDGEQSLETAIRELEEETNISEDHVDIKEDITFTEEYTYVTGDGKDIHKVNTFYLGFVEDKTQTKINIPDEIAEIGWFTHEEAKERLTHKEAKELLEEVWSYINKA